MLQNYGKARIKAKGKRSFYGETHGKLKGKAYFCGWKREQNCCSDLFNIPI
jgi:hypothetical protein